MTPSTAAMGAADQSFVVGRYRDDEGIALLSGVQALVRLPLLQMRLDRAAGVHTACLITGYEGSPLAGYDLELGHIQGLLDEHDVVFQPAVNEELAATAVGGSQLATTRPNARYDGVLGVWYGKAPGLDRASDAIRHGNLQGADYRGGALLIVGDDPATKSSSLPSASELALADLAVPVLYPGSVAEVLEFGLYAIALSRLTGLWTSLKIVVGVADATATVDLTVPDCVRDIITYAQRLRDDHDHQHTATALLSNPVRLRLERELNTVRLARARQLLSQFPLHRVAGATDVAEIGVVSAGKTYYDVRQALSELGLDDGPLAAAGVRLLKLGGLYPDAPDTIREFARDLRRIVVVEEKRDTVEREVRNALYGVSSAPMVVGRHDASGRDLLPAYGELDVDTIRPVLARLFASWLPDVSLRQQPKPRVHANLALTATVARTPYFCSGCPHSRSTPVPEGSLVGAGIGCHALITRSPRTDLGENVGLTQMGGEGAQWNGMAPFVGDRHIFQNLGDGTLMHSGSLAIRAAVAAGHNITYKILYNSAVAMTGGQEPAGALEIPALTRMLEAEGVRRIVVTTDNPDSYRNARLAAGTRVVSSDRLIEAQTDLRGVTGVSVLIHDQECAAELRRRRKRGKAATPDTRVLINPRVCEGCGDCGQKSNCLSVVAVETEFGTKTQIHQESCNFDQSCLQGQCPAFVTVTVSDFDSRTPTPPVPDLDDTDLPAPTIPTASAVTDFSMRVTGIGGTGVVTVSQIVAMAALLEGYQVTGIDQTGMAQKGGPVVSDLKISSRGVERSSKLAEGECDLYLVADLLTGVEPMNLAAAATARTTAVVSTSRVAPGELIGKPFTPFPDVAPMVSRIGATTRPGGLVILDALAVSNRLFGNDVSANLVLLGAAFQAGVLPVSATAIERAIGRNGVAVAANVQAFRRGRQAVAAPDDLATALALDRMDAAPEAPGRVDDELIDAVPEPDDELLRLLSIRVTDLAAYQDRAYARRYVQAVRAAREAELRTGVPGCVYSAAVARYLYKLMAYKDEYEVARLSRGVWAGPLVRDTLGRRGRASLNLLPPTLTRFGLKRKVRFGPGFRWLFGLLYRARVLRGTPFDPFGRHPIRRLERRLVGEYIELIEATNVALDTASLDWAIARASAPDLIRGFDEVKLANVQRYRERLALLGDSPSARGDTDTLETCKVAALATPGGDVEQAARSQTVNPKEGWKQIHDRNRSV
jgi:indolepyruvate ferredoxin oxidoreductase